MTIKRFCRYKGIMCSLATEFGYCNLTACINSEAMNQRHKVQATLNDVATAYENGYQQGKFEAQQWIPCSERLPEQDGEYLVTAISDMGTLPVIMITSFFKDSNYGKNHWHTGWSKSKVMGWMPLPSPYKGESEDT